MIAQHVALLATESGDEVNLVHNLNEVPLSLDQLLQLYDLYQEGN